MLLNKINSISLLIVFVFLFCKESKNKVNPTVIATGCLSGILCAPAEKTKIGFFVLHNDEIKKELEIQILDAVYEKGSADKKSVPLIWTGIKALGGAIVLDLLKDELKTPVKEGAKYIFNFLVKTVNGPMYCRATVERNTLPYGQGSTVLDYYSTKIESYEPDKISLQPYLPEQPKLTQSIIESPAKLTFNLDGIRTKFLYFGGTRVGQTLSKTVEIENIGGTTADLTLNTAFSPFTFSIGTASIPAKGRIQVKLNFTPAKEGDFSNTVNVIYNSPNSPLSIDVNGGTPPAIVYSASYNRTVGQDANIVPTIKGTVSECSINKDIPSGSSFEKLTGSILGTFNSSLNLTVYTVICNNKFGISEPVSFSLTVSPLLNPPVFSYTVPEIIFQGQYINIIPTVSSGSITGCNGITPLLPAGLTYDNAGRISGIPSELSSQKTYTISCGNSAGYNKATLTFGISAALPAPPSIYYPSALYVCQKNVYCELIPVVTGSVSSCVLASGTLPTGMYFNTADCSVKGIPSVVQNSSAYSVTAYNSGGSSFASFNLQVNSPVSNSVPSAPVFVSVPCFPKLNSSYTYSVKTGFDPDGNQVRIRCQITGSKYGSSDPAGQYVSGYFPGGTRIDFPVAMTSLGFQSMACRTEDELGAVSSYWNGVSGICGGSSIKVVP